MISDLYHREHPFSEHKYPNGINAHILSNTVMAVVPDSNRIPFYIYSANNFSNRIFSYHIFFSYIVALFFFFCNMQGRKMYSQTIIFVPEQNRRSRSCAESCILYSVIRQAILPSVSKAPTVMRTACHPVRQCPSPYYLSSRK